MAKAKQSPPMRVRKKLVKERPDTDDPSQMMAAEAACEVDGPLIRTPWQDDDPADDGVEDEVDGTPETP